MKKKPKAGRDRGLKKENLTTKGIEGGKKAEKKKLETEMLGVSCTRRIL